MIVRGAESVCLVISQASCKHALTRGLCALVVFILVEWFVASLVSP